MDSGCLASLGPGMTAENAEAMIDHHSQTRTWDELKAETLRRAERGAYPVFAIKPDDARDALAMIQANRDFHVAIAEAGRNTYFTALFSRLLDEGRRILRLYYQSFDDILPRQYVDDHEQMVIAIEAHDADLADRLSAEHARQIVRQIQSYIARDTVTGISLS